MRLANDQLEVIVDPRRGAQVTRLAGPDGRNLLACRETPVPLPASLAGTYGDDRLDWLSDWRGGWQELFPNAGPGCEVDGVPIPFHGEVSRSPWEVVRRDEAEVVLRCGARLPLVLTRTMRVEPAEPVLRIEEEVRHVGNEPVAFVWGHHPAFQARNGQVIDVPHGQACVSEAAPGSSDIAPGQGLWPYMEGVDGDAVDLRIVPETSCHRLLYLPDLQAGWVALRSPSPTSSVALAWDTSTFPHLWLWVDIDQGGFPFYGNYRVIALEPQSSWPATGLAAATELGRAHIIEPGATRTTWLTVTLFEGGAAPVCGVDRDGHVQVAPVDHRMDTQRP